MKNTGFISLFLSTGMFLSISLLSDSWLWKMSWEGVPFLILGLESSQTRFVPVSTSFIIPICQNNHVLKQIPSSLHHIQSIEQRQGKKKSLQDIMHFTCCHLSKVRFYHLWNSISWSSRHPSRHNENSSDHCGQTGDERGLHLSAAWEGTQRSPPKRDCCYFPECTALLDLLSDQNYITTALLNKYKLVIRIDTLAFFSFLFYSSLICNLALF